MWKFESNHPLVMVKLSARQLSADQKLISEMDQVNCLEENYTKLIQGCLLITSARIRISSSFSRITLKTQNTLNAGIIMASIDTFFSITASTPCKCIILSIFSCYLLRTFIFPKEFAFFSFSTHLLNYKGFWR